MMRELLPGLLLLLLHEEMPPLGRVLPRMLGEGTRGGAGGTPRRYSPY